MVGFVPANGRPTKILLTSDPAISGGFWDAVTPSDGAQAKWYFYRKKVVFTTFRFPSLQSVRFPGTRIPVIFHHWRSSEAQKTAHCASSKSKVRTRRLPALLEVA